MPARLTYLQMYYGAEKNSFDPIVASGANGSMPHAVPGDKSICQGEFVTMDFGCVCGGYCSDMTRTVAVGEPTEEMRQVYDAVLRAQLAGSPGPGPGYPAAKSITLPGRCSGRRATATILATASVTGWDWKSTKSPTPICPMRSGCQRER